MARYAKFFSLGGGGGTNNLQLPVGTILDATLRQVQDGLGTGSPLYLSTGGLRVGTTAGSAMYWDDTNNRLGIGTNVPSATTHIVGAGNTSATTALILQNSSGLEMLKVTNDSKFKIIPTALMPDVLFIEDFRFPGEKVLQLGTRNNAAFGAVSSRSRMFIDAGINAPGEYLIINSASGNSVGINETTPTAKLHIKGSGSTSATTSLLVQNSSAFTSLRTLDNGEVLMYPSSTYPTDTSFRSYQSAGLTVVGLISDRITVSGGGAQDTYIQGYGTYLHYQQFRGLVINNSLGATTSSTPSALVEIQSTTQGFLPPRMTTTQKNAIASPANGLIVYDTDLVRPCFFNGATWITL
jgi:hypothetical protein